MFNDEDLVETAAYVMNSYIISVSLKVVCLRQNSCQEHHIREFLATFPFLAGQGFL